MLQAYQYVEKTAQYWLVPRNRHKKGYPHGENRVKTPGSVLLNARQKEVPRSTIPICLRYTGDIRAKKGRFEVIMMD